jgi:hypothetical protein
MKSSAMIHASFYLLHTKGDTMKSRKKPEKGGKRRPPRIHVWEGPQHQRARQLEELKRIRVVRKPARGDT